MITRGESSLPERKDQKRNEGTLYSVVCVFFVFIFEYGIEIAHA